MGKKLRDVLASGAQALKRLFKAEGGAANAELRAAFAAVSAPGGGEVFYQALLRARLQIAAKPLADKKGIQVVEVSVGPEGGLVAFLDSASLLAAVPKPPGVAGIEGRALFAMALEQKRDFVLIDPLGMGLAFRKEDIARLAQGRAPARTPRPHRLASPNEKSWRRIQAPPSERVLEILREETSREKLLTACYLLETDLGGGDWRTALAFQVEGQKGLEAVPRAMQRIDRRLAAADWGGPLHIVVMTGRELAPLKSLAVAVLDRT